MTGATLAGRRRGPDARVRLALVALLAALAGPVLAPLARAQEEPAPGPDTLVVGSKAFTENRVLAEIMGQLLADRTGLEVEIQDGLGGTLLVFEALQAGHIDLYPEYTGTGWAVVLGHEEIADPLETYATVAAEYRRRHGIRWLQPFGFSNSYALAVRGELARALDLRTISDLKAHQDELRAGYSHEFLEREDGWPGLSAAYELQLADLRGMEHGLAFTALEAGEVDVIDAWTTDGKLLAYDVQVLEDDRAFFPPYHGAPIVREELLARHPEVAEALSALAFRIPEERMQQLNRAVEEEGRSFRDVARGFLVEEGLLGKGAEAVGRGAAGERRGRLWTFVRGRLGTTLELTGQHLLLTGQAVLAAILLAVPLGILLARREALAAPVLGAAGVLQTVPSLALLAFLVPFLGLGAWPALVALFLYALLPIVRNTYTGLKEVSPDLIEAARGMGLTDGQILRKVELPLATRTVMAGIRTASVISIGVATLAAFVGAGGLGEPILTGLDLQSPRLVLSGAVPAALLAIVVDLGLGALERRLAPRGAR